MSRGEAGSLAKYLRPEKGGFIDDALYAQIKRHVPVLCVDILVVCDGKVLLMRRLNEPVKGHWWTPGGRVHKWERLAEAAVRKLGQETGIRIVETALSPQLGIVEAMFPEQGSHTPTVVFAVHFDKVPNVVVDSQNDLHLWWNNKSDVGLHPHVTETIKFLGKGEWFDVVS